MKTNTPFYKIISPAGYASIPEYSLNPSNNQTFTLATYKLLPNSIASYSGSGPYIPDPIQPYSSFKMQMDVLVTNYPPPLLQPPLPPAPSFVILFSAKNGFKFFDVVLVSDGSILSQVTDDQSNTVMSGITPAPIPVNSRLLIEVTLDSQNPVSGNDYIDFKVNGVSLDYTTGVAPTASWTPFKPSVIWLNGYPPIPVPIYPLDGKIYAVQFSPL